MIVIVFDDYKSCFHVFFGFLSFWYKFLFVFFALYQIFEIVLKGEDIEYTIGDFLEFFFGLSLATLLFG